MRWKLRRDARSLANEPTRDGDWAFEVVDKVPGEVDFGFDVTNCAVCSLFRRHEVEDLVPHLCALDDQMSRAFDLGLRRTQTKARGGSHCDFRYRLDGEPLPLSDSSLPVID